MPSLEDFFEEAIEQADPSNMVEEEYKYRDLLIRSHTWLNNASQWIRNNKFFVVVPQSCA